MSYVRGGDLVRVTSKGQVTIPASIRERFGLLPDTEVEFVVEGDTVKIVRATNARETRGDRVVRHLRGRAVSRLSTDEILALTRKP
jgi:AbrB family looped-hinge helix DNA binding protein